MGDTRIFLPGDTVVNVKVGCVECRTPDNQGISSDLMSAKDIHGLTAVVSKSTIECSFGLNIDIDNVFGKLSTNAEFSDDFCKVNRMLSRFDVY